MRKRNIILVSVLSFLLVSGAVVFFIVIPFVGKSSMLHPDHEAMYMYPHEKGMTYENITFSTSDSLDLKGWFVEPINTTNPNANTTMIVLHGASHSTDYSSLILVIVENLLILNSV